jgi:hypothetical protein
MTHHIPHIPHLSFDGYNSNADSQLDRYRSSQIAVNNANKCNRHITAEYIIVHYTVAETGPYSISGLHLFPYSAI